MEIRANEYIRTKDGVIAKVEEITNEDGTTVYWFDNTIHTIYCEPIDFLFENELEKYIAKHSDFLGELIEVGDYINGFIVEDKWEDAEHFRFESCDYWHNIDDSEIRCVVTKEQLEKMRYKVGD